MKFIKNKSVCTLSIKLINYKFFEIWNCKANALLVFGLAFIQKRLFCSKCYKDFLPKCTEYMLVKGP